MTQDKPTKRRLTPTQKAVLKEIKLYYRTNGWMPSTRELGRLMGWTSSESPHAHLIALEEAGYLTRGAGARQIRLV